MGLILSRLPEDNLTKLPAFMHALRLVDGEHFLEVAGEALSDSHSQRTHLFAVNRKRGLPCPALSVACAKRVPMYSSNESLKANLRLADFDRRA